MTHHAHGRDRSTRAGAFLAAKLGALDEQLAASLPRVLGETDDEAIHDLRVAIRRLRTILRIARPVYGRFLADAVRRAFTDIQRATGALRDEEVLGETLSGIDLDEVHFVAWRARRRARERMLRREVIAHLRSGELDQARRMLAALVVLPVRPGRDADLGKFARRAVERARREVEKDRDCSTTDAAGLHALRIAYKNLRYAAEILAEALPADLAAMAKPAAHFQKRLGEIHDVDMALLAVGRARGLPPRTQSRILRMLERLRDKRVSKYVADMAPSTDDAAAVAPTPEGAGAPPERNPEPHSLEPVLLQPARSRSNGTVERS
jgi:CHAD domain-containing protein